MPITKTLLNPASLEIQALGDDLNSQFLERKSEINSILLALVAKEHCLLLGPHGTAKSALTSAIAGALDGSYFELLFSKFTTPEEVFGPISLKGLENDEYRRVTAGYAPEAEIMFADEIFKANAAILNAKLTLLNERQFDTGGKRVDCPLEICIGASNELPEDESLAALFDRFVLRRWVSYIKDRDQARILLTMDEPNVTAKLSRKNLATLRDARKEVDISGVVEAILDLKDSLAREHGIVASDRRWRKCVKLVQATAVINGRLVAEREDLLVLADALWDRPEDHAVIYGSIAAVVSPDLQAALALLDAATEMFGSIDFNATDADSVGRMGRVNSELKRIALEADRLNQSGQVVDAVCKVRGMQAAVARAAMQALGLD